MALVSDRASLDWLCWPFPHSEPVFGKILDPEGGSFAIEAAEGARATQRYLPNTNILETTISDGDLSFRVMDFCPRFEDRGKMFRPNCIVRIVEPITGVCKIRVRCRPISGWRKTRLRPSVASHRLVFERGRDVLFLETNFPLTALAEELEWTIAERVYFVLTLNEPLEGDVRYLAPSLLERTASYWRTWVKHCSIPSHYQAETIRSALVLKLHCYEDTGAILASPTTSLPEELGGDRNWDYRHCWLRDSYFTLSAFHNLGHFEEMEGFLKFLLGLVDASESLHPVYAIDRSLPIPERTWPDWKGYQSSTPVRSWNQAAEHVQNDVYGELVLALSPIFFDERFQHLRTPDSEKLFLYLALRCAETIGVPDAGLWELRSGWQDHSFTNLMCWAGLDRVHSLIERGVLRAPTWPVVEAKHNAERAVLAAVHEGAVRNGKTDSSWNAALLQLPLLRFPHEALVAHSIDQTAQELVLSAEGPANVFLFRYRRKDDFGVPRSAFLICSFWWVQALARTGRVGRARRLLDQSLISANSLGLFSEHFDPFAHRQLGNFPQAYSHVGLINAAFAVSPPWWEVL